MRRHLYIPAQVRAAIRDHVTKAAQRSAEEFSSAAEDEDVMTGHFGARLLVGQQTVTVSQDEFPGEWKWSFTYRKFRGRGPNAPEKLLGADGVFELVLDRGYRVETKSLLFQAKMEGEGGKPLFEQCLKLSTWREAAFVLEYAPSGFNALTIDEVVGQRGAVSKSPRTPLAQLLGGSFVDCEIGDNDLRYDSRTRRLIWRTAENEVVAADFGLKHRIGVRVQAPKSGNGMPGIDRIVQPQDIHRHRMEARDEEILAVNSRDTEQTLKASKTRLALAYHPDRAFGLDQQLRDLMSRRSQEINDAFARLRQKKADHR